MLPLVLVASLAASAAAQTLTVSGAHKGANGEYEKFDKSCYRRVPDSQGSTDQFICFNDERKRWLLQRGKSKDKPLAYHISSTSRVTGGWMAWDGSKWSVETDVRVVCSSGKCEDGGGGSQDSASWGVAATLIGVGGVAVSSMWFVHRANARGRLDYYIAVSEILTVTVALIVGRCADKLVFKQLVEENPPLGFGLGIDKGYPTVFKAMLGLPLFVVLFSMIAFTGYKVQYSGALLSVHKTLGVKVVAVFGMFAFWHTDLWVANFFVDTGSTQPSAKSPETIWKDKLCSLFAGVFLVWMFMAALRAITKSAVVRGTARDPVRPWASLHVRRRMCFASMPLWSASPTEAEHVWKESAEQAEDEVSVLVVAFAIQQFLSLLINGSIPGLREIVAGGTQHRLGGPDNLDDTSRELLYWCLAANACLLVALGLFYTFVLRRESLRASDYQSARWTLFRDAVNVLPMSAAWSLSTAADMAVKRAFPDTPESLVKLAFACTATAAMPLLLPLVGWMEEALYNSGHWDVVRGRVCGQIPSLDHREDDPTVWARHLAGERVLAMLGLFLGFAWGRVCESVITCLMPGLKEIVRHETLARLVASAVACCVLLSFWRTWVLPRGQTESAHEEEMEHEGRVEGTLGDRLYKGWAAISEGYQ